MGTINRPNSPLTASDGYSEVDANEVVIAAAINGNLNHENLASEGVRNANIDKDEVFAKETWDNILSDGHFPVWSSGTSSVPDSWTAELTATIARDDAPTYAPSAHYSCKITGAGAAVEGIYQTIELRKNSTYTVNLKVKATAGDTAVIKVVDGDDAEKASQEYTDADWQTDDNKKYFTFTTGTTTNAGEIKIKLLAKVDTDIVWFGEVQVTEGTMSKGFQYISSDADTVDTYHATDTATDAKLLAYSGIPRMIVMDGPDALATEYVDGDAGGATVLTYSKIYLPAKNVKIRCWANYHYTAGGTAGKVRFHFDSETDTVEVTVVADAYAWQSATGTLTTNASVGKWVDMTIELYNVSAGAAYDQSLKGYAVAFEDF